jgi:hypothetical protein
VISVVCWKWYGEREFLPSYVNRLRSMFNRHLMVPHRLVCITDEDTHGIDPRIEIVPMPKAALRLAHMKSAEGGVMPSCYRRLWMFSPEARSVLGDRVLLTDIDAVLTGDITHLVERDEPFVGWRPMMSWGNKARVAGGVYLMTPGAHPEVWDDFSEAGVAAAKAAGFRGSDQAWISYKIGATCAIWKPDDGIYALSDFKRGALPLPEDARMVQFAGFPKPWEADSLAWVRQHYR